MRRTKEEAEKTKNKIMRVALTVFNQKGYEYTTLEDIAKSANVTRGAIYHYFDNKADLLKEIALHHKDNMSQIIENRIKIAEESPFQTFYQLMQTFIERLASDSFFRDFEELKLKTKLTGELAPLKKFFDNEFRMGFKHLIEYLNRCQNTGSLSKEVNIEAYAISIAAAIAGIMEIYTQYGEYIDVKKNLSDACKYLLNIFEK